MFANTFANLTIITHFFRKDFGEGRSEGETCMAEVTSSSQSLTTVCMATTQGSTSQSGHLLPLVSAFAEFMPNSYPALISVCNNKFNTICMWVRPTQFGTLLYLAEDGLKPHLAVLESSNRDTGILISSKGSFALFNYTAILDGDWHHICLVVNYKDLDADFARCVLYVDGAILAKTDGLSECSLNGFNGHVVFGTSSAFSPNLHFADGKSELVQPLNAADSNEAEPAFDARFAGMVGNFFGSSLVLSAEEVLNLQFACWEQAPETPDNVFNDRIFKGMFWIHTHYDALSCQGKSQKYLIPFGMALAQSGQTINVRVTFEQFSLLPFEVIEASFLFQLTCGTPTT